MMNWKQHFVYGADYQHWANEVLFESLGRLDDMAIASDQGLFFRSIHFTLDHILLVNRLWWGRLSGENLVPQLHVTQCADFRDLKKTLQRECRQFQHWLEAQPEAFFDQELNYVTTQGDPYKNWVRDILTHLFNHSTHHRGQISAVISRLGVAPPEMDYIYYKRAMQGTLEHSHPPSPVAGDSAR